MSTYGHADSHRVSEFLPLRSGAHGLWAFRPINMTREGPTLVSAVNYNPAGAITSFERRESASSIVANTYAFNAFYQMTNQPVSHNGTPLHRSPTPPAPPQPSRQRHKTIRRAKRDYGA